MIQRFSLTNCINCGKIEPLKGSSLIYKANIPVNLFAWLYAYRYIRNETFSIILFELC